jgi:hypothetical protein
MAADAKYQPFGANLQSDGKIVATARRNLCG